MWPPGESESWKSHHSMVMTLCCKFVFCSRSCIRRTNFEWSGIILISICPFCSPDLLFMTSAPQNALLKHYKTSGTRRYSTCKAGNFTKFGTLPDARSHAFSELAQIAPFSTPIRYGQHKILWNICNHSFITELSCGPGSVNSIAALISLFNLEFREHPDRLAIYHIDFQGRYASNTVQSKTAAGTGVRATHRGQLVKHPRHDVMENTLLGSLLKTST